MRVQHNIPAMNAYRNYNNNSTGINKNLEKLSSGYKINRAGDDAAGLAISEKMRAQITGLEVAQKNAKDGISLVQTAEGALTEVQDMLNRMYKLAEQSANGTYSDKVDRVQLQKEVGKLRNEIDRIATTANFNGQALLDGTLKDSVATQNGASDTSGIEIAKTENLSEDLIGQTLAGTVTTDENNNNFVQFDANSLTGYTIEVSASNEPGSNVNGTAVLKAGENAIVTIKDSDGNSAGVVTLSLENMNANGSFAMEFSDPKAAVSTNGSINVKATPGTGKTAMGSNEDITTFTKSGGLVLWVGAEANEANALDVSIDSVKTDALVIDKISIETQEGALNSLQYIEAAINKVSDIRGGLGATQNRLEHTINNLSVMQENMQDAESTIRDTDVAEEMMKYTKNSILVQSAQAMLAQANQLPQGVLQLLQ